VPSCVLVSCEFKDNIFVVAWTSEVIPEETVVPFPSTSGVLVVDWMSDVTTEEVVDWMSDVTTEEVVVALLSVDWTSDITPDEVVVDISSTSGVFVVVWTPDVTTEGVVVALLSTSGVFVVDGTPDVTTEGIVVALLSTSGVFVVDGISDVTTEVDVSLPSTFGVFVVDGISDVTTEEVVVKDPSPFEVLVIADIIVEVVGSTVLVTLSTISSVVAGSGVTTFDISVVTWITTVDVGPVHLINIVIFL
jgi:hypothetical protein